MTAWRTVAGATGSWEQGWGPMRMGLRPDPIRTPPPGLRRAGVLEFLAVASCLGQVGYRASMNMGASLGYATMGRQPPFLAFQNCVPQRSLLVRLEGQATRAHRAEEAELAQRAKVGYRPCRTRSTRI